MSSRRFLPALFLLFVGSGCAALIYEIVWFQLLQLVIGSSSISLGILLGTFMGGMCIGSLLLARLIAARQHPLRVYAALELGIGVLAIAILAGMPLVGGIYTAWAGEGVAGIVFRAIIAGICLLPPTILMGATLPAISRWVKATPDWHLVARILLRRQHRRRRDRQPGRRLLPAACSMSRRRPPPAPA
jgi:spermidine synthase